MSNRGYLFFLLSLTWLLASAAYAWYPNGSMYVCDWRFISGPRAGQAGIEQRWIMTAGSTTKKTGFTRTRWANGGVDQLPITLTQRQDQWRASVSGVTCNMNILDSNRYEMRACSNGVELDCRRHPTIRGGVYSVKPVITRSGVYDANEGGLNSPRGFMYFTAAGSAKTGRLGCVDTRCYPDDVWASNFQGSVRHSSGGKTQWEWSIDQLGDYDWVRHLCPGQCDNLCSSSPLSCTNCQINSNLYCPNAQQEQTGYYGPRNKKAQLSQRSYPYIWGVQQANSTAGLQNVKVRIKEHDPAPFDADDKVGAFTLSPLACIDRVWGLGFFAGWATNLTTAGEPYDGNTDIAFVDYELRCDFEISDPGWVL